MNKMIMNQCMICNTDLKFSLLKYIVSLFHILKHMHGAQTILFILISA